MPAIHIRNVPESLIAALRERAARKGTSMQQEVLSILTEAANQPAPAETLPPLELVTVRAGTGSTWSREDIYGDEGR